MFENKFNSKKADPLVEAAKAAMELGQKRREAIAAVNEEFGVYNRNAVVRENLAAYDARIEEVYQGMMAGNLTEELSSKQKKMAALGGNPKKIDAPDLAKLRKGAKIDEKKGCYEEKKLADKDYDHDGKIESPKDEVWGSRLRAAKLAGKLKEGLTVEPKDTTDYSGYKGGGTYDPDDDAKASSQSRTKEQGTTPTKASMKEAKLDEISKEKLGRYIKTAHYRGGSADFRHGMIHGRELVSRKKSKGDQADAKELARTSKKREKGIDMATDKLTGKAKVHAKEEHINEAAYSAKAARAGKDIGKPGKSFKMIAKKAGERYGSEEKGKKVAGAILAKIRAKHMKEDNIEEMVVKPSDIKSGETLGQAMNRLQGKTAIKGGKNDPSSANFAGPKPSTPAPAPKPSAASNSMDSTSTWKSPSQPSQSDTIAASGAPKATAASNSMDSTSTPTSTPKASTPTPTPVAAQKPSGADAKPVTSPVSGPGPSMTKKNTAASNSMDAVNESVQVGTNRYRIV